MSIVKALSVSSAAILSFLISSVVFVSSLSAEEKVVQTKTADACYKEKDEVCLERMFSDIIKKRTEEKEKALYLLGLLRVEDGKNLVSAKELFSMLLVFGGDVYKEASIKQLKKLYEGSKVEFDTLECAAIESEACFNRIINGTNPHKAMNARYVLGKAIYKTDPRRSYKLLRSAADAGHLSARCELAAFYADDEVKDGIPMDYHQSVTYRLGCMGPVKPPFKRFNKKHFAKYDSKKAHKAYAHRATGYATFVQDRTSAEIAARTALELCKVLSKDRDGGSECKVINVNGKWVKDPVLANFEKSLGGVKSLVSYSALNAYKTKYSRANNPKVFVQSPIGPWQWYAKGNSGLSLEKLKAKALRVCNQHKAVIKTKLSCKLVNINGEWVN